MTDNKDERRGFPRWAQGEKARVIAGADTWDGVVTDVSATGLLVAVPGSFQPGAVVTVELTDMPPFRAEVQRTDDGSVALRFLDGPHYVFR